MLSAISGIVGPFKVADGAGLDSGPALWRHYTTLGRSAE